VQCHHVRRLRGGLDLDAKLALRGVRVEVARGSAATGADVREEAERGDACEGVGEGEDVAADRQRCGLLLLVVVVVVQLVDVKDDLVRSLRRNRWDDEMAIVEEGKNGLVITTYSNRLCKSKDQGLLTVFIRGIWGG
jgi:hypothetical protein